VPTLVVAGTTGGVGKTTVTLGLIACLRAAGLNVAAFKLGPDLRAQVLHGSVAQRPAGNLDAWMMTRAQNLASFHSGACGADVAVVEGAMGLFDGRDGLSEEGSTAQMAKWLRAPVVLVVDCAGVGRSAAAMVRGYEEFDSELRLAGIIFNRLGSSGQMDWLKQAMSLGGVSTKVLGGIPKDGRLHDAPQHELQAAADYVALVAGLMKDNVDLQAVVEAASMARVPPVPSSQSLLAAARQPLELPSGRVKVGVARDAAFCCYYHQNLVMLEALGAELVPFSPLMEPLPLGLSGLYLGGGQPELLQAAALASNSTCLEGLRAFVLAGGVVYAECGGLMYLCSSMEPLQGRPQPLAGVFPFSCLATGFPTMGYVEVETQEGCAFLARGLRIRGHYYHMSEVVQVEEAEMDAPEPRGALPRADWRPAFLAHVADVEGAAKPVLEGYALGNVLASLVHLHWGSCPEVPRSFVAAAGKVDVLAASTQVQHAVQEMLLRSPPNRSSGHGVAGASSFDTQSEASLQGSATKQAEGTASANYVVPLGLPGLSVAELDLSLRSLPGAAGRKQPSSQNRSSSRLPSASEPEDGGRISQAHGSRQPTIASLLPSGTEIVFALGLQDRLICVSDMCDFPPEARSYPIAVHYKIDKPAANLMGTPRTRRQLSTEAAYFQVDKEFLRREAPQLLLTHEAYGAHPRAQRHSSAVLTITEAGSSRGSLDSGKQALRNHRQAGTGTTTLVLRPRTVAEVLETITQVGVAAGVPQAAASLVDSLRTRLRSITAKVLQPPAAPRPRVALLTRLPPRLCVGGFWLPELIHLAGGKDVLQDPGDSAWQVSWHRVRASSPEVLILALSPDGHQGSLADVPALAAMPGWWSLPAVYHGQVYICDNSQMSQPGPRLADAVDVLARILHPEVMRTRLPPNMVLKLSLSGGRRCRDSLIANYFEHFS